MNQKIKIVFLCIMSLLACKNEENNIEINPTKIDLSNKSKKLKSIKDIIRFKKFIQLKDIEEQDFIISIDKIEHFNDKIYVLDKNKSNLFVFSNTGKFMRKIGERGMGPGEYSNINTFNIDKSNGIIYILSGDDISVNSYNLEGNFKKKIRFDTFYPKNFALLEDKGFVFDTGYDDDYKTNVIVTDLNGKIKEKYFKYPEDLPHIGFGYTGGINNLSEKPLYADATSPLMYSFSEINKEPQKKYIIDFGDNTWIDENRYDYNLFERKAELFEIAYLTNEYIYNPPNLILNYTDGNKIKRAYYSEDKLEVITHDNIENKNLLNFFRIPIGMDNKDFISMIDFEIYYALNEIYPDLDESLQEIDIDLVNHLKNMNEASDPILLYYEIEL